jgi:hypothetical protein
MSCNGRHDEAKMIQLDKAGVSSLQQKLVDLHIGLSNLQVHASRHLSLLRLSIS